MRWPVGRISNLLILVLVGGLSSCSKSDENRSAESRAAREAVAVAVAPVTTGPIQRYIAVVGTLYGDEEVTLSAKVSGR